MTKPVAVCKTCEISLVDSYECVPYTVGPQGLATARLDDPGAEALCIDCAAYFVVLGRSPLAPGASGWLRRAIDELWPRDPKPAAPVDPITAQVAAVVKHYSPAIDDAAVELLVRTTVGEARAFVARNGG